MRPQIFVISTSMSSRCPRICHSFSSAWYSAGNTPRGIKLDLVCFKALHSQSKSTRRGHKRSHQNMEHPILLTCHQRTYPRPYRPRDFLPCKLALLHITCQLLIEASRPSFLTSQSSRRSTLESTTFSSEPSGVRMDNSTSV